MKRKPIFLNPGDKINHLTVIERFPAVPNKTGTRKRVHCLFECDCGNRKIILAGNVTEGNTKSCGCLLKESQKARILPDNAAVIYQIILGYKRHARDRELNWELTLEQVREIISKPCHYCGATGLNKKVTKNCKEGFLYNGIDRIDSLKHYTLNNVVPCCKICNYAKSNMYVKEFQEWAIRLGKKAMADQWS